MYSDVAALRRGSIELGVLVCNNTGEIMWVAVKVLKMNVLVDIGEASGALQWCHTSFWYWICQEFKLVLCYIDLVYYCSIKKKLLIIIIKNVFILFLECFFCLEIY
jgi:hypothetical protein